MVGGGGPRARVGTQRPDASARRCASTGAADIEDVRLHRGDAEESAFVGATDIGDVQRHRGDASSLVVVGHTLQERRFDQFAKM